MTDKPEYETHDEDARRAHERKSTLLPEPWRSMTEEQLHALKPVEARQMLTAVRTPTLLAFRAQVNAMQTSELILAIADPGRIARKLVPPDEPVEYNYGDERIVVEAALLAISVEIDRRIPRP